MTKNPDHKQTMNALKRIEGQIRGIQKMVDEKRYCIDILTQLSAVSNAVKSVQNKILETHLNSCVLKGLTSKSKKDQQEKIDEIITLLRKMKA